MMTAPGTIVRVAEGRLEGAVTADGEVRAFKGVPYARPPVGELRWRLPEPPEHWNGVRPAQAFGATSLQPLVIATSLYAGGSEHQSEDCLTLNLWTAAESANAHLPVMVWFHLGAYQYGGGSLPLYDGAHLAREGAVVVTVNHRLGRLGFFAHPELTAESPYGASGNYGMHDLIQALRWLAENVAAFGGDPARVTVFGLSAGSLSVSLLMTSPQARGLFHRAIGESGAALGPTGPSSAISDSMQDLEHAERTGVAIAERLGARSIEELRRRTPSELMAATTAPGVDRWVVDGSPEPFSRGGFDGAFPIVDGHLLPEPPFTCLRHGRQAMVPLLTGSVADEASGMPYMPSAERFRVDSHLEYGERADEFLRLFPAGDDDEAATSSARANADRVFIWQNWAWAQMHSAAGGPTYYYHFSRVPPVPPDANLAHQILGAFHGAEIPYVFRNLQARDWPWGPYDRELSSAMAHWLNFARTGDPNGAGLARWHRFDRAEPALMHFGNEAIGMGDVPRREFLAFWEGYYGSRGLVLPPSADPATAVAREPTQERPGYWEEQT